MTETLTAPKEHPLALPGPLVAKALAETQVALYITIERDNPKSHPRQKHVTKSSPNASPIAGWTLERVAQEYPFPYGGVGDRLWIQEDYQVGFSSHVSHCGYLYHATDLGRTSQHGVWCYQMGKEFYDFYDRPFTWIPAADMKRVACRLVLEIMSVRVGLKHPEEVGSASSNPFVWIVALKRLPGEGNGAF